MARNRTASISAKYKTGLYLRLSREYIEIGTNKEVIITWNCPIEVSELMINI